GEMKSRDWAKLSIVMIALSSCAIMIILGVTTYRALSDDGEPTTPEIQAALEEVTGEGHMAITEIHTPEDAQKIADEENKKRQAAGIYTGGGLSPQTYTTEHYLEIDENKNARYLTKEEWDARAQINNAHIAGTSSIESSFTGLFINPYPVDHCYGVKINMTRVRELEAIRERCKEFVEVYYIPIGGGPAITMTYEEFERRMR
ncbi:MAG: hypothetical protein ABIH23_20515, partial [bacterium]